jgi:transposase-like protein
MATKKRSEVLEQLPKACCDESAAADFLEHKRWGETPRCPLCGSVNVYQMKDRMTGERSKRYLWRCRDCSKMYTVRTGTVMAESLLPLTVWCTAIWAACCSKNGVSAKELERRCQINYRSALFVLNRIRHAVAPAPNPPKLSGEVEVDEHYSGGSWKNRRKADRIKNPSGRGRGTRKIPVLAVIERGGEVRTRVVPSVNGENLRSFFTDHVEKGSRILTDSYAPYRHIAPKYGRHEYVPHSMGEYVSPTDPTCHSNGVESFFARVKRTISGTHHSVSPEHLDRYLSGIGYMHNTRKLDDGERVVDCVKRLEGRRLMYKDPA